MPPTLHLIRRIVADSMIGHVARWLASTDTLDDTIGEQSDWEEPAPPPFPGMRPGARRMSERTYHFGRNNRG